MSFLGNLVWIIFGGFISSLGYLIGGLALCLTIVGIPFGLQCFKLAGAVLTPFGKEITEDPDANSTMRVVFNLIWIVLFGWEIAVAHMVSAIFLGITIIGIPFAIQHVKLAPLSLFPFGRDLKRA